MLEARIRFLEGEERRIAAVRDGQEKSRKAKAEQQRELLDAVIELRDSCPGRYDSDLAAATYLIDHDPDGDRWGYYVDSADPDTRLKAIDALRRRIGRATKSHGQ